MLPVKKMHEKQICNLLSQSPEDRYEFFVRYCSDFEKVWGLVVGDDSWVIFKDNDGDEIFPLWPHYDLARVCCFEEHQEMGAKPQSIDLDSFTEKCIPDMILDKIYFGIFYSKDRKGLVVDGDSLKKALNDEVDTVWR